MNAMGKHVLIVEDDESTAGLIAAVVRKMGWNTVIARSGGEAQEALAGGAPALIVMDLGLPDTEGPALLQELRERIRGIPVLGVSVMGEAYYRRKLNGRFPEAGFLAKPFRIASLMKAVADLVPA